MAIQTLNPATGEIIKTYEPHKPEEIEKKLSKAVKTFHVWRKIPLDERIQYTKKLRTHLEGNKEKYGMIVTLEMGRPIKDAIAEIDKSIGICTFYIENAHTFLKERHVPTDASKSYIQYDPLGVILGIMPWNYPFTQVFRALIPIIIAGNTFVLKHASNVPLSAITIEKMFIELGFPTGVMTTILIEGKETDSIIADDRIAAVTVTGGEQTGKNVAKIAGMHLKKSVLELGGSDAFIVLEDADIEKTVKQAVKARTSNAGQSCNSPKRFIIHKKVAKEFIKRFLKEMQGMKIGDPMDPTTCVGPVAKKNLRDQLHKQVQESIEKGARLLLGGKKREGAGFFYEPTVLDNVKKGMPVFDEEVFGPVASIIEVKDADEAIQVANNSHLGLSASIWTEHPEKYEHFIDELHVGLVFFNQAVRSDPRLPYGGVKKSGYGRELGEFGIREFTNIKTVLVK